MHGDFTRLTFRPEKHYRGVHQQQGRVQLDADWNEQVAIEDHRDRTTTRDVVGCGGPQDDPGFAFLAPDSPALTDRDRERLLPLQPGDFLLGKGRFYVEGIECVNEAVSSFAHQPDLPDAAPLPGPGTYVVYLDVWQRHVTALEDPDLREVALGGADTATRSRTIWQLKAQQVEGEIGCATFPRGWIPNGSESTGRLRAHAEPAEPTDNECFVPAGAGYRGPENQLYRVEIHDGSEAANGPTYKWSRDNGYVAARLKELTVATLAVTVERPGGDALVGFDGHHWVELTDEPRVLSGRPGFFAEVEAVEGNILTVKSWPTNTSGQPLSMDDLGAGRVVRRWDAPPQAVSTEGWLALESGVEIEFEAGAFRSGDSWQIPARTLIGEVEWPEVDDEPAFVPRHGTAHWYCTLFVLDFDESGVRVREECRKTFPPLTELCAQDVCFDGECSLTHDGTVHGAIEALCRARDLRHHNKHLHGWGIVDGLEVVCGPIDLDGGRRGVTVKPGYAIDCDGTDVDVAVDVLVDLLARIRAHDEAQPNAPFLRDGRGEVCLTIGLNDGEVAFGVEAYDARRGSAFGLLAGTIWEDVYEHCIKRLLDFANAELGSEPAGDGTLVSPRQERLTTLTNLLVQLVNPANGPFVYVSKKEDAILRGFYERLKALLQSETFCAMFAGARQFPDYPADELAADRISTVFGKGFHSRLRLHPGGRLAYTLGEGSTIHVYNLETEAMVAQVEFPTVGAIVRDVAFSPDGRQLYAAALLRGKDTIFAVADLDGIAHTWRPGTVLCDFDFVRLHTATANRVFALAKGKGVFLIDPSNVAVQPPLVFQFKAVGHLVPDPDGRVAWATAASGANTDLYDSIVRIDLSGNQHDTFALGAVSGSDDITVALGKVYAVVDRAGGRRIVVLNPANRQVQTVADEEDSEIRLAAVPARRCVVLAVEDGYRLALLNLETNSLIGSYRLPVQVGPVTVAVNGERGLVVLNHASNTLSLVDLRMLAPEPQLSISSLVRYRTGVIDAFVDLAGGFLQYLKDCFCDHLLIKQPHCDPDDKLYLACIQVRDGQVYKVCNFSRRKYVKSFPAVDYWLSIVPILPLINSAVEAFCCAVLPDFFRRFQAPQAAGAHDRVRARTIRSGMEYLQKTDIRGDVTSRLKDATRGTSLVQDYVRSIVKQPPGDDRRTIRQAEVADRPTEEARGVLENRGAQVDVREYDAKKVTQNLRLWSAGGGDVAPGTKVVLYQSEGKAKYYAIEEATQPDTADLRSQLQSQRDEISRTTSQMTALQSELSRAQTEHQAALAARDQELGALRDTVDTLQARVGDVGTLRTSTDQLRADNEALRAQIADVGTLRVTTQQLQAQNETLRAQIGDVAALRATTQQLQAQNEALRGQIGDVSALRATTEQLQVQNQTLQTQVRAQQQATNEALALRTDVTTLKGSLETLQASQKTSLQERDAQIGNLQGTVARLDTRVKSHQTEMQRLTKRMPKKK